MAVNWHPESGVVRTRHGYSAPPEKIVILDGLSGRKEETDVTELSADIKENGQLEPAVCWKNDAGWPVLAAGHRRWRAISEINKGRRSENRIQLEFIYNESKTEEEAFDYTIRENRNRMQPTPLDDAYNMHIYQTRFGLGLEQIAKKYFPAVAQMTKGDELVAAVKKVEKTLSLLELSEDLKEKLQKGEMSTSAAEQLAKMPRMTQDKVARIAENYSKKNNPKTGEKQIQVAAVKAAKAELQGKPRTPISENTPVKLLEKYKAAMTVASSLACEVMALQGKFGNKLHGEREVALEFAEQIAVICHHLKVPQQAEIDRWAEENKDLATVLTPAVSDVSAVA